MARAITLTDTRPYVLRSDRTEPAERQTTFELGGISAKVRRRCLSLLERDVGAAMYELVRHGVRGWQRLSDGRDGEISPRFEKSDGATVLREESMTAIGAWWLELGQELLRTNTLDEGDAGNSEGSPSTSPA